MSVTSRALCIKSVQSQFLERVTQVSSAKTFFEGNANERKDTLMSDLLLQSKNTGKPYTKGRDHGMHYLLRPRLGNDHIYG